MTARTDLNRRRTLTGVVVLLIGLAILAASAALAWSWRTQLPDPVATHWGTAGTPDGFAPQRDVLRLFLGGGTALVLLFGGVTCGLGQTAVIRRIGAAATIWVALFLSILVVGSLYVQRGLADAHQAGDIGGVLLVAFLGSLALAVLAAVVVPGDPRDPTDAAVPVDAPRVPLPDGDRSVWRRRVSSPASFLVAAAVALMLVAVALLTRTWAMLAVPAVVILVLGGLSAFVVRVDRDGLTVRSVVGWPSYLVPLDEVLRADATEVSPVRDFGGWGWRVGRGGRVGVALRKGQALEVTRTGGRSFVVTVDGADIAAGILNALADRSRHR